MIELRGMLDSLPGPAGGRRAWVYRVEVMVRGGGAKTRTLTFAVVTEEGRFTGENGELDGDGPVGPPYQRTTAFFLNGSGKAERLAPSTEPVEGGALGMIGALMYLGKTLDEPAPLEKYGRRGAFVSCVLLPRVHVL